MSGVYAQSISTKASIAQLEQTTTVMVDDMYMANYFNKLLPAIEGVCPAEDIAEARGYISSIKAQLERQYASLETHEQLSTSYDLYERLRDAQPKINALPEVYTCVLKYVLYDMMYRLRDYNVEIMERTGLIRDFEWFTTGGAIHGFETKKAMLQSYVDDLRQYKELLWTEIRFAPRTTIETTWVWTDIASLSDQIMELSVYKSLYKLRERGVLRNQDIDILQWVISLNQELSCGNFHGNYSVTETFDGSGALTQLIVTRLPLSVNVCGNYFLLNDLADHYEKIITHELWHHYYYFYDRGTSKEFEDMCRVLSSKQNGTCADSDYVSAYAQSNAIEDYADHFMHRFLGEVPHHDSDILHEKSEYFEKKFRR